MCDCPAPFTKPYKPYQCNPCKYRRKHGPYFSWALGAGPLERRELAVLLCVEMPKLLRGQEELGPVPSWGWGVRNYPYPQYPRNGTPGPLALTLTLKTAVRHGLVASAYFKDGPISIIKKLYILEAHLPPPPLFNLRDPTDRLVAADWAQDNGLPAYVPEFLRSCLLSFTRWGRP